MAEEEGGYKTKKMKIEKPKKTKEKLSFTIKDIDISLVNAYRRLIAEGVPVLAIDTVEFTKNDSVLYDEILAHRLGLIPLKADLKTFRPKDTCTCKGKGCNKCTVKLKLAAKGKEVLSTDLKCKVVSSVYEIPLVRLTPEQELEFVADARLGTGKEHAKFIPGLAWHTYNDEKGKEIVFHIESWGQMKPAEIFMGSTDALKKSLKEFNKALSKL